MKEPWEITFTEWAALPVLYGTGPYWSKFHRAIMARSTFEEAVAAAKRLAQTNGGYRKPHVWTDTDKDVIRTEYAGNKKSLKVLAGKIGVTTKAVQAKVTKLKLGRWVHHVWTDEEKDLVRTEYDGTGKSVAVLAGKIGVTTIAVKGQIQSLKLTKKERRDWTEEELEYLGDTYGILPDKQICEHLHRSRNSIVLASKRHLKINRKANFYTAKEVAKLLGVACSKTVTETWQEKGFIKGRKSTVRCGLNMMWLFSEQDIEDCLRKYPWLVKMEKVEDRNQFRRILKEEWERDPWYTSEQAGSLLGVHFHTVVKYLNQGLLQGVKKPALCWQGEWVIRRSNIQAYLTKWENPSRGRRKALETSQLHIYTTTLPNGTVEALRVLGVPIPSNYTLHNPVVLEHWLLQSNKRIKSRPWDAAEVVHWESEDELSEAEIQSLKDAWELPTLRPSGLRMATEICNLQRQLRESHNGLAKRLQETEDRLAKRLDGLEEHYGDHGLSIGDLEEKVRDLEARLDGKPVVPRDQKIEKPPTWSAGLRS